MIEVKPARASEVFHATRLPVEDPWVDWALESMTASAGKKPALLPNLGGSLPNDAFSEILACRPVGPHSYPPAASTGRTSTCSPPAPREGLAIMAGLFWDLGEAGPDILRRRQARA